MNVELLRKIAAVIQERPAEFGMDAWHCETQHCIGGYSQVLTGSPENDKAGEMAAILEIEFIPDTSTGSGPDHADDICEAGRLFYRENWPAEFLNFDDDGYEDGTSPAKAAARIEHFIATEGRE
jgi:hypothetical protein